MASVDEAIRISACYKKFDFIVKLMQEFVIVFQVLETNQFSVTRHYKQTGGLTGEQGIPGVFFIYEFSPMMVKYSEKRKYVSFFIVRISLSSSLISILS